MGHRAILAYIGERTQPPPLVPARDPPARETDAGGSMDHPGDIDPLARREPDCISGQRIAWRHPELRR